MRWPLLRDNRKNFFCESFIITRLSYFYGYYMAIKCTHIRIINKFLLKTCQKNNFICDLCIVALRGLYQSENVWSHLIPVKIWGSRTGTSASVSVREETASGKPIVGLAKKTRALGKQVLAGFRIAEDRQRLHTHDGRDEGDNESSERVDDTVSQWRRRGRSRPSYVPFPPGFVTLWSGALRSRLPPANLAYTHSSRTLALTRRGPQPSTSSTSLVLLSRTMC